MSSDGSTSAGSRNAPSQGASLADALRAGNRAFEARDYAEAARHYTRVVSVDGTCALAWYSLGNARWRRGDRAGAIEAYRRAVGEDPERARAWQNLSTAHLSGHDWSDAAEAASRAVSIDPSRSKAWNNLAVARFAKGDLMGTETALRRAVETDPKFAVAWANFGRLLAELGRLDAARAAYEKALAYGETDSAVRIGLASVLGSLGDTARAEVVLAEAARAEPQSVEAWSALGDARRLRSAHGPALEAYEAAAAAGEDMSGAIREKLSSRRRHAAIELATQALEASDRDAFTAATDRLRDASGARVGPVADDALMTAVTHCIEIAAARATDARHPEWISADFVRGVLERAISPAFVTPGDRSIA